MPASLPAPLPSSAPDITELIPTLEADLPAESFMADHFWRNVGIGLGVAILLAAVALFFVWRRRRSRTIQAPLSAEQRALEALDALQSRKLPLHDFSLELSLLLREYVTGETQDPALFETHEEFSRRFDALASVPPNFRRELNSLLSELAALKYAPPTEGGAQADERMIERARALITGIALAQREARAVQADQATLHLHPAESPSETSSENRP